MIHWFNGKKGSSRKSAFLDNLTIISHIVKWTRPSHILPDKTLLKYILKGVEAITFATVTFLWLAMLYKVRHWSLRGLSHIHVSSQNLVFYLFPISKKPLLKKSYLVFVKPFQNRALGSVTPTPHRKYKFLH
jgi:hypothetical protein